MWTRREDSFKVETVKQDRLNTAAITHMRNLTYILLGIIIFGFVVTLSHGNNIVINCVIIAGCAFLGFVPFFDKKRIRADWAKLVFGIIAVIGIAKGVVRIAWDLHCFTLGGEASHRLNGSLQMAGGVILGFLLALILSGQLSGTKRDL